MFERFTDRARRTVVLSQDFARQQPSSAIHPEHLLAGLTQEAEGLAAQVLAAAGVTVDQIQGWCCTNLGELGAPLGDHMPFTAPAKRALETSLRESLQLGHNYIGTEHILLGLLQEGSIQPLIQALGLDSDDLRSAMIEKLNGTKPDMPPKATPVEPSPSARRALLRIIRIATEELTQLDHRE